MIQLGSLVEYFETHGKLRRSQRKTIAALTWASIRDTVLGIAAIGHSLAMAETTKVKYAIKRVDRFIGNAGVDMEVACRDLIETVIGNAREILLTLDWTDPKTKDGQFQTVSINVRAHGRAPPIAWKKVRKTELKGRMRDYEEALCAYVAPLIPADCHVILLADRGFGTARFFRFLDGVGWDWVIRGKGNILVRWKNAWRPVCLLGTGRPLQWDDHVDYGKKAAGGSYADRLVIYADKVHTDSWFLLVSPGLAGRSWGQVVALYGKHFTCEESYKDQKNQPRQGFHMNAVEFGTVDRWDSMWLIFAWAYYWLNVGGWVVEHRGEDRDWRANTSEKRTHALWRLGSWGLEHHDLDWHDLVRHQEAFQSSIAPVGEVVMLT